MADHVDGSIVISTELDQKGFQAGSKELLAAIKSLTAEIKRLNSQFSSAFANTERAAKDSSEKVKALESQVSDLQSQVQKLKTALKDMDKQVNSQDGKKLATAFDTSAAKTSVSDLSRELASLSNDLSKLDRDADRAMGVAATPLERFNTRAEAISQKIDALKSKIAELGSAQIPTADYAWDEAEIQKTEATLNKLLEKQAQMDSTGVNRSTQAYQNLQANIDLTKQKLAELKAEQEWLKENGQAFVAGVDTEQYAELSQQLETLQSQYAEICGEVDAFGQKNKSVFSAVGSFIGSAFEKGKKKAVSALKGLLKNITKLHSGNKTTNKSFLGGIGTMLKYTIGVRTLYTLFSKLRSAMVTGFSNLAQYSSSTNAAISSVMSALTQLKNSIAAAFDPILKIAAPALTTLINKLSTATSYLGMFTAALRGQNTYTRATEVQENYAASLDKTAKSAKKANQQLAGIDELNIISPETDTSSSAGSVDPSQMFENAPIDNNVKSFVDRLKEAFANGDFTEIGKILGNKINEVFQHIKDFISWDNVGGVITEYVNNFCDLVNSLVDTIDWNLIGSTFAAGINTIVNTFYLLLTGINWENIGTAIAAGLNSLIRDIDWAKLGVTAGEFFNAIWDGLYGFAETFDWARVGRSISLGMNNMISTLDWTREGKTVSDLIIGLFDMFNSVIAGVNWFKLGHNIGTFIANIDWMGILSNVVLSVSSIIAAILETLWGIIASLIGEGWSAIMEWWTETAYEDGQFTIQGLLNGIADALAGIAAWIYDNIFSPFIKAFKDAFGIHSPSTVMAEQGGYIIDGFTEGIKNNFNNCMAAIKEWAGNVVEWFTAGEDGKGLVENFKSAAKDMVEGFIQGIKDKIDDVKKQLGELGTTAINKLKDVLGIHSPSKVFAELGENTAQGYINGISDMTDEVKSTVGDMADAAASGVNVFDDIRQAWSDCVSAMGKDAQTFSSTIESSFKECRDSAQNFSSSLGKVGDDISNLGDKFGLPWLSSVGRFVSGCSDAIDTVIDFADSVQSTIEAVKSFSTKCKSFGNTFQKVLNTATESSKTWGGDVVDNLSEGLTDNQGTLSTAIRSIKSCVTNLFSDDGWFATIWNKGKAIASELANGIDSSGSSDFISMACTNVWNWIQNIFSNSTWLQNIWDLGQNVIKWFADGMSGGGDFVSQALNSIGNLISGNGSSSSSSSSNGFSKIFESLTKLVNNGGDDVLGELGNIGADVSSNVSSWSGDLLSNFGSWGEGLMSWLGNLGGDIGTTVSGILGNVGSLGEGVSLSMSGLGEGLMSMLGGLSGTVGSSISGLAGNVVGGLGTLGSSLSAGFSSILSSLSGIGAGVGAGTAATATVGTSVSGILGTVGSVAAGALGGPVGIAAAVAALGLTATGLIGKANGGNGLVGCISTGFDTIGGWLSNIFSSIGNILGKIGGAAVSAGKTIVNGAVSVVKTVGSTIKSGVKAVLGFFGLAGGGVISAQGIKMYANGTSNATHGSMFVAGESGAELVGHINGRTEVMNRFQLAEVMQAAIINGMAQFASYWQSFNSQMVVCTNAIISAVLTGADTIGTTIPTVSTDAGSIGFAAILNQLSSVAQSPSFAVPAISTGTVAPYSVVSGAGTVSAGLSNDALYTMIRDFYMENIEPTIKEIASDTKRQADKKEKTVVQIGSRSVAEAVNTQNKANGFTFAK